MTEVLSDEWSKNIDVRVGEKVVCRANGAFSQQKQRTTVGRIDKSLVTKIADLERKGRVFSRTQE